MDRILKAAIKHLLSPRTQDARHTVAMNNSTLASYRALLPTDPWESTALSAILAMILGWLIFTVGAAVIRRATARSASASAISRSARMPASFALPLLTLQLALRSAPDELAYIGSIRQLSTILLIGAVTWLLMRIVQGIETAVTLARPTDMSDNLAARRIQTQTKVLSQVVRSVIGLLGFGMALMTIPDVREIGASLLASAGVAGIVAGLAARPVLGNLLAGMQIAFSQPIRIDDVVIVDGEWGSIEEITSTYVVVKIWDERRLIVPLQWWIEHPFQNWTRSSANLLGSVFLWVDFRMPLAPVREALERICQDSPLWDGRVCKVQVTETSDRAMQLRCLVSTANASHGWDLRCLVREELMALLQRDYPQYLPRLRADVESDRVIPGP